jgi:hypothetical protein
MSKVITGELQFADKAPTEKRLQMFRRLSGLKLDSHKTYLSWLASEGLDNEPARWEAWQAALKAMHTKELFELVRRCAVFDESFRLPSLEAGTDEFKGNIEQRFAKLMELISMLALTIQREQENLPLPSEQTDA